MSDKYIHYGSDHFDAAKFRPILNSGFMMSKPLHGTGLWASPINSPLGWRDWCVDNKFNLESLDAAFRFVLKPDAAVYHIHSIADVYKLPCRNDTDDITSYPIDYEAAARMYDAIEVDLISGGYELVQLMYGWDCNSILIMNPDVVMEVE